jgi:hypothetical protein
MVPLNGGLAPHILAYFRYAAHLARRQLTPIKGSIHKTVDIHDLTPNHVEADS